MSPLAALALVGVLALALGGKRARQPRSGAKECPKKGTRLLLIGDSLAVGLAPHLFERASACLTPFHDDATEGSHVDAWLTDRLLADIAVSRPNVVLISLGGNDMRRTDPDNVRAKIRELVGALRQAHITPLWIAPPAMPFSDPIDVRGMWEQAIGSRADWFATEASGVAQGPDGIHPTAEGYRLLAGQIWQWLSGRLS